MATKDIALVGFLCGLIALVTLKTPLLSLGLALAALVIGIALLGIMERKQALQGKGLALWSILFGALTIGLLFFYPIEVITEPTPSVINSTIIIQQESSVPSFITKFNLRMVDHELPPEQAWDLALCLDLLERVDKQGYYDEMPQTIQDFCDSQQLCTPHGCTYLSEIRGDHARVNAQEQQRRIDIAKNVQFVQDGTTIKSLHPARTTALAIPALTNVFVFFNTSRSQWQVLQYRIQTSWIPESVSDPKVCNYVWNKNAAAMVNDQDACWLLMATRNQDTSLCTRIQSETTRATCVDI